MKLPNHDIRIETERLLLRPFSDSDLDRAVPYYQDAEFLRLMEHDPPDEPVTAEHVRLAGEAMASQGYYFAIEIKDPRRTVGEACVQRMNLERGLVAGETVVRCPIGIWDRTLWGQGLAKEAVRRLMQFAFEELEVDRFCAMDVMAYNARSRSLWNSCGLRVARTLDSGALDFEIRREDYMTFAGISPA